jgi:hypothetical protein
MEIETSRRSLRLLKAWLGCIRIIEVEKLAKTP